MSDENVYRKEPPEDSCTCSTSIFREFRDVEGGVPKDSPVFKERERIARERAARKQQEQPGED